MNYKALDEALEYLEEARVVKQYYDSNYYITNTKLEGVPVAVYKYKEDADKIDAGINAIKKNLTDIKASAAAQIWRYLNKHGKPQGSKDIKYDYQTKSLDYTHYSIMDGDKYNTY